MLLSLRVAFLAGGMHHLQMPIALALSDWLPMLQAEGCEVTGERAAAREDALQDLAAVLNFGCAQVQRVGLCPAALKDLYAIALLQLLVRANHLLVVHLCHATKLGSTPPISIPLPATHADHQ